MARIKYYDEETGEWKYADKQFSSGGGSGQDGFSPIAKVEQTADGAVISITDKNGITTATIANGKDGADGAKGDKGDPGATGQNGSNGTSATHSWNGTVLTITSASGTSSADLKGAKGDKGDKGDSIKGDKGDKGDTGAPGADGAKGDKGDKGDTGADGVSPTVAVSKAGKVTTISITDKNGTKTATINDGADGEDAPDPDAIPSYWQTPLDNGVEAINTALCEAGKNKSAFLFYSDAHWNQGSQMAPTLLKYLYNHTGMTKTFFGGDIVNDEASDYDTMKYLWDWRKQIKDLPNHHSVVGNHDDGNETNNLFSEQYVYGYLLAAEETPNIVRGESGLYYYVDSPAEKTRYLCLDTAYKGVDADQTAFITEALKTTPANWHIVVVSHIWYLPDYNQYDVRPIPITGLDSGASAVATLLDNYNARSGAFADCGAWVEFCIGGHVHIDYDGETPGGIPIILVETDSWHTRGNYTHTAGTTTESSVNGIVADYDNHKIHVVRIGRGASREIEVSNTTVSYTNLIPTAVDIDGVTIYNGKGYEKNIRQSGSSGEFRDNTGSCCTGYIKTPVNQAFTVYLKNIVNNTNNNYGCVFNLFSAVHTATTNGVSYQNLESYGYSPVYDDNGNVIQITVTADKAAGYMVVGAVTIDDTSIITINEPID